jgi:hypothetical protein
VVVCGWAIPCEGVQQTSIPYALFSFPNHVSAVVFCLLAQKSCSEGDYWVIFSLTLFDLIQQQQTQPDTHYWHLKWRSSLEGISHAHHWIWTQNLISSPQIGLYQQAITTSECYFMLSFGTIYQTFLIWLVAG